jgi:hypothetical protein
MAISGTARWKIGIIRLLLATAWSISFLQLAEVTDPGLTRNKKLSAASMLLKISSSHSAVTGMSFKSIQASRF